MKITTPSGCLWVLLGIVGIVTVSIIVNGWAISTLWGWFVAPVFALPYLSIAQAIGLACMVGLFTNSEFQTDKSKDLIDSLSFLVGRALLAPVFIVGIGWIVRLFI